MSEKEIAKEILIKMIESSFLSYDEMPDTIKNSVDLVCEAYKQIYKTISDL